MSACTCTASGRRPGKSEPCIFNPYFIHLLNILMKKIFVLAAICVVTACTKHANDIKIDTPTPTVIVFEPTAGAVYHNSDSITINALAIAPAVIHGYDLAIKKGNDTTTYYFEHVH